tara:strand:+ start:634 stop:981 length:348 start_codon:yes stop_codon:yes gene_type:complete
MKKALKILETLIPLDNHKSFFLSLFDVVSTNDKVAMIPSKSGKSVNILNFPVSNIKQLESHETVATLIDEVKNIPGVSIMTNQSNDYDTPLLSIVQSKSDLSSEEKKSLFAPLMQ